MKNLQEKIWKYFKCHSINEIDEMIKRAEEYINNYDYNNNFYLSQIESELEKVSYQILNQENRLKEVQIEQKNIARSA